MPESLSSEMEKELSENTKRIEAIRKEMAQNKKEQHQYGIVSEPLTKLENKWTNLKKELNSIKRENRNLRREIPQIKKIEEQLLQGVPIDQASGSFSHKARLEKYLESHPKALQKPPAVKKIEEQLLQGVPIDQASGSFSHKARLEKYLESHPKALQKPPAVKQTETQIPLEQAEVSTQDIHKNIEHAIDKIDQAIDNLTTQIEKPRFGKGGSLFKRKKPLKKARKKLEDIRIALYGTKENDNPLNLLKEGEAYVKKANELTNPPKKRKRSIKSMMKLLAHKLTGGRVFKTSAQANYKPSSHISTKKTAQKRSWGKK